MRCRRIAGVVVSAQVEGDSTLAASDRSTRFPTIVKTTIVTTVASVALLGFTPVAFAEPPEPTPHGPLPPPSYAEAAASPDWVPTPPGLAY